MSTIQAPNTPFYTEAELLKEIQKINIHSSESYEIAKRLLKLSNEHGFLVPSLKCYCAMGYIYTMKAEYHSARSSFSKALILFEEIKNYSELSKLQKLKIQLQIEGGIGNTYALQTSLDLALPYYYRALKIAEDIKDTQQICNYLSNIGTIHVKNGDTDSGLTYFIKAKDVMLKKNIHWHLDTMYSNIASCLLEKGDKEGVLKYLAKALEVASINKNKDTISIIYTNYADIYGMNREYELALQYIEEAILLRNETKHPEGLMRAYLTKGRILKEQNKYSQSIEVLHKALSIAEASDLKEGKEIAFDLLAQLYKSEKDFEKCCEYLERMIEVKSQISNEKTHKTVANLTLKYESEKKDLKIKQLYQKQKLLHSKNEELKLFASKASHDMKEPLRMIGSFSGLLKKRYGKQLNGSALEFLDIIQNANKRMSQLLDDLLDYTVVGSNLHTQKAICLNEVFSFVQQNLQLVIEEKKAVIEVESLPIVKAHHTDMMQLFQNLISNALKFCTRTTPHIRLTVKELEEEWQIAIHDNGIGISVENQFKIFDIFIRLHSREEYEGTGIGLAICKKIVEQLGGEIWIESKVGFGTSFFFTLPKLKH